MSRTNAWFRFLIPFFFLLCVWGIFSRPFLFKGQLPFPSTYLVSFFPPWNAYNGMPVKNSAMPDIITQIYPWRYLSIASWKHAEVPLWNPYSFAGTPHAGNYQSAAFFPLNILFFLFSFSFAWSLLVLLQPLLAGIGMYLYLGQLGKHHIASLIGAVSFMFCGFITVWMGYATLAYAILSLPYCLFFIERFITTHHYRYQVFLSVGIAFSFFAGHFQMSLYAFAVVFFYLLFLLLKKEYRWAVWPFVFSLGIGVLFSAPQFAASVDAFGESNRTGSFISSAGIPFQYLLTLVAPDFFGNPVTRNDWFGQYAEWASFIGVVPLFFAVFSMIFVSSKRKHFFLGLLVVSLLLALKTPVADLFYHLKIPVLSTSVATRMIVLVSFSLVILGVEGIDWWYSRSFRLRNKMILMSGGILVLLGILWVVLLFGKPLLPEYLAIAKRNSILPSVSILAVIGIFLAGGIGRGKRLLIVLLLFITSFEMLRFSTKWMPFDPPENMYPSLPVITYLKQTIGTSRVFGNVGNELSTYFGIPSLEGYDALYQTRYGEFISSAGDGRIHDLQRSVVLLDRQGMFTERYLELLGARFLLYRKSDGRNVWAFPHWRFPTYVSRYTDGTYEVLENMSALPRVFFVSSYEVIQNPSAIISRLTSDSFPYRDRIILERDPHLAAASGMQTIEHLTETPTAVSLTVSTEQSRLLFLSDTYDSGWNAYVDGTTTPVYRADFAFRAIVVPSGTHLIDFRYEPRSFYYGLFGFGLALGTVFVGFALFGSGFLLLRKNIFRSRVSSQ